MWRLGAAISASLVLALVGAALPGCSGDSGDPDPCAGITCSGHGSCEVDQWGAVCVCTDYGYQASADRLDCIAAGACVGVDCSGHGQCGFDDDQQPICECDEGYAPGDGLTCVVSCSSVADCLPVPDPVCDGATLTTYTGDARCEGGRCYYVAGDTGCGDLGCCTDHCCRMAPSNRSDLGSLEETDISKSAPASFDTVTDCTAGSGLGDCTLLEPAGRTKICACKLDSLTMGSMRITGEAALAILAHDSVTVSGTVDISGSGDGSGPGAEAVSEASDTWLGGRGGSFGGRGGNVSDGGYVERGVARLEPLLGGQDGQDACGDRLGGGGGGALQITAGVSVTVSGTIHAGGGGGQGGNARSDADEDYDCIGGAGGGSGGAILLEAPEVTASGALAANGGGGGGGGNNDGQSGGEGADATSGATAAAGGEGRDGQGCALQGVTEGGDGGRGSAGETATGESGDGYDWKQCPEHQNYLGGGGGGGGAGRIRINTLGTCRCDGTCSPAASCGMPVGE